MKPNQWWPIPGITTFLTLVLIIAGCAEKQVMTHPETVVDRTSAAQALEEPSDAADILLRMARFLAETQRFSVNIRDSYDVLQESGQKIEFGETRMITVSRPNGLRVEIKHSDGEEHLVLYDGNEITTFSPAENVFAQTTKQGGIDQAVMYFLKDLGMRLPLAVLLVSRFPEEIERRTESLDYVESSEIDGAPAHHLAGRTETVDYQVWVAKGSQPLPLRVVLTYKNEEGQPQFRAQFSDWNLKPEVRDSLFAFTPPEGARKILFVAQLPQIALKGAAAPAQPGEKK